MIQLFLSSHTLMLIRQMYRFPSDSDFKMVKYVLSRIQGLNWQWEKGIFTEKRKTFLLRKCDGHTVSDKLQFQTLVLEIKNPFLSLSRWKFYKPEVPTSV